MISNDKIPDMSTVAFSACKIAQVTVGIDVLVTSAGPIGPFNIMVAKALGANQVIVTGIQKIVENIQ